jgi:uncharacterized protein (TIGR02246 family)
MALWWKRMRENSGNGVVVAAIGLILILLLVVGGAGYYYLNSRNQMALAAAEMARAEEARARMIAVEARAEAERAAASRPLIQDQSSSSLDGDTIRSAVEAVLRTQEDAWNRGDLAAFMDHYWKSDDLTFVSDGKTFRGWNATLKRYQDLYRTPDQMGRLTLSGLEIIPLDGSAALVLGQFHVQRDSEPGSGNFSLVFRKFNDRWLIVHDHTSRLTTDSQ